MGNFGNFLERKRKTIKKHAYMLMTQIKGSSLLYHELF